MTIFQLFEALKKLENEVCVKLLTFAVVSQTHAFELSKIFREI